MATDGDDGDDGDGDESALTRVRGQQSPRATPTDRPAGPGPRAAAQQLHPETRPPRPNPRAAAPQMVKGPLVSDRAA